jgi:hypothetical protein
MIIINLFIWVITQQPEGQSPGQETNERNTKDETRQCVSLYSNHSDSAVTPALMRSVGRSVKLLLLLASTVILGFRSRRDLCSLLDMYVFRSGAFSSTRGGVGLSVLAL